MPTHVVTIEAHLLSEQHGLWCDSCCLPSVIEYDVAFVNARTLKVWFRASRSICTECEQ